MIRRWVLPLVLLPAIAGFVNAQTPSASPGDPVVQGTVRVADQIELPAAEPGVLVHLAVKEGALVREGQEIGKIDDRQPQMQKRAAIYALNAAVKRAKDTVEIEYAKKQADVAEKDHERMQEANRMADRAITQTDVDRARLDWDRALLAIKKAIHEQEVARLEAYVKQAELDAANLAIERSKILAPFDGMIETINRKQNEWVNPGDTILTLVRLDTMHVDAAVDRRLYDPHELQDCEVTVEVAMARERKETFRGRIIKISSVSGGDHTYYVRAEVANRQEHGSWMLRHGLPFSMKIHLNTGGAAAVTRAP